MPTVRDILNECQYGKNIMDAKINEKNILENKDEESGFFCVSQRISDLARNLVLEDTLIARPIEKMITKFSMVEERIRDGKTLTPAYKKMQATSINEDYNAIISIVGNRKEYNKVSDKRVLGKILAAASYGMKEINESAVIKESENALFNSYVNEEKVFLEDIL